MPNWCTTSVLFKGKPENIYKLAKDIQVASSWYYKYPSFCNVRYLLYLNNFDTISYTQRFNNIYDAPTFRGIVYDDGYYFDQCNDGDILYHTTFDMAWYTDYDLLQIISMLYNVEYSSHSEEPNMNIYTKCRYGKSINNYDKDYNLDVFINPDYEQLEKALEESDYTLPLYYENGVKYDSSELKYILDKLKEYDIDYTTNHITEIPAPEIYGVYYHYIYGVSYDDESHGHSKYPEIDRFNIINKI